MTSLPDHHPRGRSDHADGPQVGAERGGWLVRFLRRDSPPLGDPLRPLYDAAIAAAKRYQDLSAAQSCPEAAWDDVLTPIDDILEAWQREHIDHVRDAGASGGDVPPAGL